MPITHDSAILHNAKMRDWAIDYLLHVLEKKDWSANRLAGEAGVATSTIGRPLREGENYAGKLSRTTIEKVRQASGIDPSPFIPEGMAEDAGLFASRPKTSADHILATMDSPDPNHLKKNEIRIAVVGDLAQIVATVDRDGIARLRKKLDAIETMLDD